jgi:hypothetical protein
MVKIRFTKHYKDFVKGEVANISNNEAHALIDKNVAKIHDPKEIKRYPNKMMVSERIE